MHKVVSFDIAGALQGLLLPKTGVSFVLCYLCFALFSSAQEVPPESESSLKLTPAKASKMRERITDEQLKDLRKDAPVPFEKTNAKAIEKPKAAVKADIYQISDILADGSSHTVVPKGAILSVPESLADRLVTSPAGKFQFWPDFYARNKNWIKLQEVEVDVAKGKVPLPEGVIKMMATEPKMVIAVYKGNLITVLEAPAADDAGAKPEEKK